MVYIITFATFPYHLHYYAQCSTVKPEFKEVKKSAIKLKSLYRSIFFKHLNHTTLSKDPIKRDAHLTNFKVFFPWDCA